MFPDTIAPASNNDYLLSLASGEVHWVGINTVAEALGSLPLARCWDVPDADAGVLAERVHDIVVQAGRNPSALYTTATYDQNAGHVVVSFESKVDASSRFSLAQDALRTSDTGEPRWIYAGMSQNIGFVAVVMASQDKFEARVLPMPEGTHSKIVDLRQAAPRR